MNEERENTNNPPEDEDWAMSEPPDNNTGKTEQPEARQNNWKMPEPVFRVSGGTTFSGSKNETPPLNLPPEQPSPQPIAQPPSQNIKEEKSAPDVKIQAQPYISEEFNISQIKAATGAPAKPKSKVPKIIFAVAGILAMTAFAIAFLFGVYYLFFYKSTE